MVGKRTLVAIGVLIVAVAVGLLANQQKLRRFHRAVTLWTADQETLVERFANYDQEMPSSPIRRSGPVMPLEHADGEFSYPERFELDSGTYALSELFDRWGTVGFLVLRDGLLYDERYFRGHSAEKPWMSFSASKAIVGVLVAIAHRDGLIEDLDDPLSKYAPQLLGTAWQNVTFTQALDMTTGVRWDEWELSWNSDLGRFSRAVAFGTPFDEWLVSLERSEHAPGSYYNYSSADSQALGVGLIGATKQSISSYTEREIWSKIGAEADAFWATDDTGRELALSGWNAVLRDYARLGLLFLDGESWQGAKIVPDFWLERLRNPTREFLSLSRILGRDDSIRNWSQFFVPVDGYGDYAAVGSYGQIIYVNPSTNSVVVTQSVNPNIDNEDVTLDEQFFVFRHLSEIVPDPPRGAGPPQPKSPISPNS